MTDQEIRQYLKDNLKLKLEIELDNGNPKTGYYDGRVHVSVTGQLVLRDLLIDDVISEVTASDWIQVVENE